MSGEETGSSWPCCRHDLDDEHVGRVGRFHERDQGRVGRVAAVPVPLSADLHGLAQQGQARRRQHHLAGEFRLPEDLQPSIGHGGGGNQQPQGRVGPQGLEIDLCREEPLQGVQVEGVELVGRHQPRGHVGEKGRGRTTVRRGHLARPLPEMVQATPRFRLAASQKTGCDDDGVHRAGARAAHGVEGEVLLFEQAVENAPGEGS